MEPEGSCFFTEAKDHSVAFNPVPQKAEMEVKLGGLKPGENGLSQDLSMRRIVRVAC